MFNWEPEKVFQEFSWIQNTGYWAVTTPYDLAENYSQQFLRFCHFVSTFIITMQLQRKQMDKLLKRVRTRDAVTNGNLTILVPNGTTIEPSKEKITEVPEDLDSEIFNGSVPDVFSGFISSLDL